MKITMNVCLGLGAVAIATVFQAAPTAWADPADPVDPAAPTPVVVDVDAPVTADTPAAVPAPVQHLSSPDNLPPGTTSTSDTPPQGRLGYLRDLLHAMRTQEVSGSDALLLLTQRPLDANAAPPPGPTGPVGPSVEPPAVDAVPAPAG